MTHVATNDSCMTHASANCNNIAHAATNDSSTKTFRTFPVGLAKAEKLKGTASCEKSLRPKQ